MAELHSRFTESRRSARAQGVLLIGVGVFLLISLVSYSAGDYPNASRAPGGNANWGGRVGAQAAYAMLMAMGYAAYALPALALLWGLSRLRSVSVGTTARRSAGLLSIALLLCVASGLPQYSAYTAFQLGGWLGTRTCEVFLIPYVGRAGSSVLLAALLLAALILTADVQLVHAGRALVRALALVRGGFVKLMAVPAVLLQRLRVRLAARRKARAEDRDAAEEEAEAEEDETGEDWEEEWDEERELEAESRGSEARRGETGVQISGLYSDATEPEQDGESALPDPRAAAPGTANPPPAQTNESPAAKRRPKRPAARDAETTQRAASREYSMPSMDLLDDVPAGQGEVDEEALLARAEKLEQALGNFDVGGKVVEVSPGPVVTRYEVEPAAGVKVHRIVTLADDLARVMSANGIRIQAPVPGKSVVGVEIANQNRETVYLREILETRVFRQAESKLTMALGKTISGEPFVADLTRMPHLLVAGATGSGKSICINCLISSMLYKATPDQVRLLMVDPKVVELTMYNDIPHLLVPVVTEPKKAAEALKWAVAEMEVRYKKLANLGVRNLADYNRKVEKLGPGPDEDGVETPDPMPYIVIVIDEFADLMLTAPGDVETSLMALAQKSRAVGLHIILATQRPSVNVITGVIKANFPSRIAFQVATKTDSRTILDMNGAERLLGRGDMLFLPGGQGEPVRIHGAFVSSEETEALVEALKANEYQAEEVAVFSGHADIGSPQSDQDELFDEAVRIVVQSQQASTSFLQRRMKVGYSRAARLMDELETAGIVGPAEGAKPRQILVTGEELDDADEEA